MIKIISCTFLFLALGLGVSSGWAATGAGLVVGDSLGVGVMLASHLPSFAKNSVSIRSGGAIEQIQRAPAGSTVFLSLGTNDAVGNIEGLDGGIQRIVDAAAKAQVRLVWIGPPCVFKPWDKNAIALDASLKQSLGGAGIVYVSMRDDRLCDRAIRAPDGVHFNMTGYHYMWDKVREAAGFVAEASDTVAAADVPKHKAATHKAKKHRKKKAKKAAAPGADANNPAAAAPQPGSPSQ